MKNIPIKIIIHTTDVLSTLIYDQYESVNSYHKNKDFPQSRSGSFVGYHHLITGGKNYKCKEDDEEGAHTASQYNGVSLNFQSLGVCVGFDGDVEYMGAKHFGLLKEQIFEWQDKYKITDANVHFHREFNLAKTCPGSLCTDEWKKALLTRKPIDQSKKQEEIIASQAKQISELTSLIDALRILLGIKK